MKKFIFLLLIALTIISSVFTNSLIASADNTINKKSKSYCLMSYETGEILSAENENERYPIASMCKIMSMLLIFDEIDNGKINFDTEIVVSANASGMGGSQVFLETNGIYKVSDLIKSIAVASANDATVAMAEKISGTENDFVIKMNEKAKKLNMQNTNFVNATGLPKSGQYSSAKDSAIMFRELLNHKEYFNFSKVWMDKITHSENRFTQISNTNKLIKFYRGCDSGKTGFTNEAGHCLTASAIRGNLRLICSVIGAPDSKTRFNEVSSLFNYGFNTYELKQIINNNETMPRKAVINLGKQDNITVKAKENFYKLCKKGETLNINTDIKFYDNLTAPISISQEVGKISIYENSVLIKEIPLISTETVLKRNFSDILTDIFDNITLVG